MKEHFNSVNTMLDGSQKQSLLKINFPLNSKDKPSVADKTISTVPEDKYEPGLSADPLYDEKEIEGMDMAMALDSLSFIKDMAGNPEGRSRMSNAHNKVDAQMVKQLFGI